MKAIHINSNTIVEVVEVKQITFIGKVISSDKYKEGSLLWHLDINHFKIIVDWKEYFKIKKSVDILTKTFL